MPKPPDIFRHFIAWLTFVCVVALPVSFSYSQGWILPLGNARGAVLEKLSDGTYVVGYRKGQNSFLLKVSETGEKIDSLEIMYSPTGTHRIWSVQEFNNEIYTIVLYNSNNPPDYKTILYKTDMNLQGLYSIAVYQSNTGSDTLPRQFIPNDNILSCLVSNELQNCNTVYEIGVTDGVLQEIIPCFGWNINIKNTRKIGSNYYSINGVDNYSVTNDSVNVVRSDVNSNQINRYLKNTGSFIIENTNRIAVMGQEFYLLSENLQEQAHLTHNDLTFSDPSMEERTAVTTHNDGGFYYAAYRTDPHFYPYIILGKISKFGQLQWKRGFLEYIFQYPIAITEAHDENGLIVLAQDEVYTSDNSNLFLIKTQPDGNIGMEEHEITELKVFPNPARDQINLLLPDNNPVINIYNNKGQIMYHTESTGYENMHTIAIHEFPEGLYYVKIRADHKVYSSKFMKV